MRCAVVLCALAIAVAGCGERARPAEPPAQPLSARAVGGAGAQRATRADFRAPIRAYKAYLARRLEAMAADVRALRGERQLAAARSAWRRASFAHGTIGAAYGAFGAREAAIQRDLAAAERALWTHRSTRAAAAPARRLSADVARLRGALPRLRIDPLEYSLRVHEILEDTLHVDLAGKRGAISGDAYASVAAAVAGTRVVLRTVRPLVDRRAQPARLAAQAALTRLDRAVRAPGGGYRAPGTTPLLGRERIAAFTADAAERLAQLPELLDPRPPQPARSPFGTAP